MFIRNGLAASVFLVGFSVASADAYVCQLANKSRVVQSEPCSGDKKTLSSSGSGSQSVYEQNQNAARARADLERQTNFFVRQRALDAATTGRPQQAVQQHEVPNRYPQQQPAGPWERQYTQPEEAAPQQQVQREAFTNNGGILRQPSGSSFEYDNKGNTYHRPEGSAFSYGKGGKTCFHYGDFADCK